MMTLVSELLLKNGHKVTAIVRDETKLKVEHANLSKVQADVFIAESLVSVFKGKFLKVYLLILDCQKY